MVGTQTTSKASESACIACGSPIANSECPSLPQVHLSVQRWPLLVPLHLLVCLPWLGPSETPQRTLRGRPTAKLLVALLWVWMKPFHVRSQLSPLLVAPDDPPWPHHPDASGVRLPRLPHQRPAATLRDAANTTLLRSASEEAQAAAMGWQRVAISCSLLGESATRWDAGMLTSTLTWPHGQVRVGGPWTDLLQRKCPTLLQPGGGHTTAFLKQWIFQMCL